MVDRWDVAAARDRVHDGPVPALESDEALAARAAADPNAFAELYRRYAESIRRYCGFRLRDRAAIDDVTSEIFVKALESLHKTPVTSVRPWLFAIAHNQVTDRYRRTRDEVDLATASELSSPAPSPESLAVAGTERDALLAAVALLKPDQARVIELRLAGLDGPEIRRVLNKSRSWVDTTQYRALIQLRQLLSPGQPRSPETN